MEKKKFIQYNEEFLQKYFPHKKKITIYFIYYFVSYLFYFITYHLHTKNLSFHSPMDCRGFSQSHIRGQEAQEFEGSTYCLSYFEQCAFLDKCLVLRLEFVGATSLAAPLSPVGAVHHFPLLS